MEIEHLPLSGALVLTPRVFTDERGYFMETYSLDRYRQCGIEETFVQDNLSLSRRNVLRGLHGDARMAKLVGVLRGSIFDVIVDLRVPSATRGRWYGAVLDSARGRQMYVPKGFLHGFLALEDETLVAYKQSAAYDPAHEISVAWDDPAIGIEWPLGGSRPILSARDAASPPLRALKA
ncbi:MAG: dTDP-4-dehydrorhamnose 3,5-epimerase [Candidatus Eremiobacteraeota bacterium]|nr:dTDP-4-dehydrorhamnose 3,5-epimerase [Candidatus Eremiobacteraeota bacterium]MBV8498137.1 dTDP-4-dehydrorhamnose 3,5-epimerase [Candidatus Eremiobacteraeota bacterium]